MAQSTGMMGNEQNIKMASKYIKQEKIQKVVIDPVIACKGTAQILQPKSVEGLKNDLLPLALVATPNLIEAGILSGLGEISSVAEMEEAAKRIVQMGAKHVVVKGGHRLAGEKALDLFYDGHTAHLLENELTTVEQELADYAKEHRLFYSSPKNAADALLALANIPAKQPVVLKGLGLAFFDYLSALTIGRGGVFSRQNGRLRYEPSGREPIIIAGSRFHLL